MVRGPNSICKVWYSLGKASKCGTQTGPALRYGILGPWPRVDYALGKDDNCGFQASPDWASGEVWNPGSVAQSRHAKCVIPLVITTIAASRPPLDDHLPFGILLVNFDTAALGCLGALRPRCGCSAHDVGSAWLARLFTLRGFPPSFALLCSFHSCHFGFLRGSLASVGLASKPRSSVPGIPAAWFLELFRVWSLSICALGALNFLGAFAWV